MIFLSGLVQRWTTVSPAIDVRPTCAPPSHGRTTLAFLMPQICSIFVVFGTWERHPLQASAGATEIRNELTRKPRTAFGPVAGSGPQQRRAATSRRTAPYSDLVQLPELLHQVKDENTLQNEEQKIRITLSWKEKVSWH